MPTAQVLSVTPKVKDTLLVKVPVVRNSFIDQYMIAAELCSRTLLHLPLLHFDWLFLGQLGNYFEDKTPPEDKPF